MIIELMVAIFCIARKPGTEVDRRVALAARWAFLAFGRALPTKQAIFGADTQYRTFRKFRRLPTARPIRLSEARDLCALSLPEKHTA